MEKKRKKCASLFLHVTHLVFSFLFCYLNFHDSAYVYANHNAVKSLILNESTFVVG